jgi:transcriptional regulator with XRE-family HTH domain
MSQTQTVVLKGSLVRLLRTRQHLTQRELAAAVGKYQPDISALEHGRYGKVYPQTLQALAQALGVAMEDLVGEERAAVVAPEAPDRRGRWPGGWGDAAGA